MLYKLLLLIFHLTHVDRLMEISKKILTMGESDIVKEQREQRKLIVVKMF